LISAKIPDLSPPAGGDTFVSGTNTGGAGPGGGGGGGGGPPEDPPDVLAFVVDVVADPDDESPRLSSLKTVKASSPSLFQTMPCI